MKKELLIVTAAIIKKKGKYLITQRPEGKHLARKWEFPGGIVEFGEDPKKCLRREIKEELGINIKVNKFFDYSSFIYNNKRHVILLAFLCDFVSRKIEKLGIRDYKWVTTKDMNNYNFCKADRPFIKKFFLVDPPIGDDSHKNRLKVCQKAKKDGALELDVVINIPDIKHERYEK